MCDPTRFETTTITEPLTDPAQWVDAEIIYLPFGELKPIVA